MRAKRGEAEELFKQALAYEGDECFDWPFAHRYGYAAVQHEGCVRVGHNVVCEIAHGPRPGRWTKVHAAHECNRRSCLNKRHIFWKTKSENEADKVIAGTSNRGERCANHKLTEDQVLAIYADTRFQKEIADEYGLRQQTVSDIKTGRNWRWLTDRI